MSDKSKINSHFGDGQKVWVEYCENSTNRGYICGEEKINGPNTSNPIPSIPHLERLTLKALDDKDDPIPSYIKIQIEPDVPSGENPPSSFEIQFKFSYDLKNHTWALSKSDGIVKKLIDKMRGCPIMVNIEIGPKTP